MKEIKLEHITKIEGHANLNLAIDKGVLIKCELRAIEGSRYFEGLLKGRNCIEAPELTQRICGICRFCKQGLIHLCSSKRSQGWGIDGAMADYIKLPEALIRKIPDNLSLIEGAVIEPASTVTHAIIERGNMRPGDFVVVIGPGPIGLLAAQVAKASGAKKVVIVGIKDDVDYRLKVASELNIDLINPHPGEVWESELVHSLEVSNFSSNQIITEYRGSFSVGISCHNIPQLSKFRSITYKNSSPIGGESWTFDDPDDTDCTIWIYFTVDGPGVYGLEFFYSDIIILSMTTEVIP